MIKLRLFLFAKFLAFMCAAALLVSACGPPSRETVQKLAGAATAAHNTLLLNADLPEQLLVEHVISPEQFEKFKPAFMDLIDGARAVDEGFVAVLASEKLEVKKIAPAVADLLGKFRALRALVNIGKAQLVLSTVEISLRVIGTYFALQISKARALGYTDQQICASVGLPYDLKRFELLANGV